MKNLLVSVLVVVLLGASTLPVFAGLDAREAKLLTGSIARAEKTSAIKPTAQMVVSKVEQAARLVAKNASLKVS